MTIFSNKLAIHLNREKNYCGFVFPGAPDLHGKPKSIDFMPNDQLSVLGSSVDSGGDPEPSCASILQ